MAERKSVPYKDRKFDRVNKTKYNVQYDKEHYDRVTVLLPSGYKDRIKKAATDEGKTMSVWISEMIDDALGN